MKKNSESRFQKSGHVLYLVLFALVMALMLLAILFGAHIYQLSLNTDAHSGQLRSVEGFLASTFRAGDTTASVDITEGPEGDALCLYEDEEQYTVTYMYLYKGYLVQEYTVSGYGLNPEDAARIAPLTTFKVALDGNTVRITTDNGTFVNTLRSGGDA